MINKYKIASQINIAIIKRCLLVNDNWKIKQHERKDGLNIKKRKNKQEIVAPDPILEEIFKELDL